MIGVVLFAAALTIRECASSVVAGIAMATFPETPNVFATTLAIGGVTHLRGVILRRGVSQANRTETDSDCPIFLFG